MRGTAKCKISVSQSKPPRRAFSKGGVAMFGWKSRVRASTGEARRHCHLHYAVTAKNRVVASSALVHLVEPNRVVARPQLQSKSGKLLIKPETPKSPQKRLKSPICASHRGFSSNSHIKAETWDLRRHHLVEKLSSSENVEGEEWRDLVQPRNSGWKALTWNLADLALGWTSLLHN